MWRGRRARFVRAWRAWAAVSATGKRIKARWDHVTAQKALRGAIHALHTQAASSSLGRASSEFHRRVALRRGVVGWKAWLRKRNALKVAGEKGEVMGVAVAMRRALRHWAIGSGVISASR